MGYSCTEFVVFQCIEGFCICIIVKSLNSVVSNTLFIKSIIQNINIALT